MDDSDLHCIKLVVKRVFYVNQKTAKEAATGALYRKVAKTLPRSHPVQNLYEYKVEEAVYQANYNELMKDLSTPEIEGIYESNTPLDFRAILDLGCLCVVQRSHQAQLKGQDLDTFDVDWLQYKTLASYQYLEPGSYK